MTDKEKLEKLRTAYNDIVWMAIRYADRRLTYAPSTVRRSVNTFKEVFPDWEIKKDDVIEPPTEKELGGLTFKEDCLYDLFE